MLNDISSFLSDLFVYNNNKKHCPSKEIVAQIALSYIWIFSSAFGRFQ